MFCNTISPGDLPSIDEVWLRSVDDRCVVTVTRRGAEWETVIIFGEPLDENDRRDVIVLSGDHREALTTLTKPALKRWIIENEARHPSTLAIALERLRALA